MARIRRYSGTYFPFRAMEVVNKILAMVVVISEISKGKFSLHVSNPSESFLIPLFGFALKYLLFSSYFTEIKGIGVQKREFSIWLEGLFSRFSSSGWVTIKYHQILSEDNICYKFFGLLLLAYSRAGWSREAGGFTTVFNRGLCPLCLVTLPNEDMTVNGSSFAGLCWKQQTRT